MKKKTVVLLLCTMSVVLASCGKTTDAKNEVQETTEVAVTEPETETEICLLYTSPSPRDRQKSRMPSSA